MGVPSAGRVYVLLASVTLTPLSLTSNPLPIPQLQHPQHQLSHSLHSTSPRTLYQFHNELWSHRLFNNVVSTAGFLLLLVVVAVVVVTVAIVVVVVVTVWAGYSDWLRAGRYGDRIPVEARFSAPHTGPGAHTASWKLGTRSNPGVIYSRGVLLTTHPLLVPRSWKSRAIPLPTLWATTGPVTGSLYMW